MKEAFQTYLPQGEVYISQQNSRFDSRYKFTAKELDDATQYSYFGARYLDTDVSVWLSVDPMSDQQPSFSPYAYCYNNPLNHIDFNGEIPWPIPYMVRISNGAIIIRCITSPYGPRNLGYGEHMHYGVDMSYYGGEDRGTPVFATHSGTVLSVGGLDDPGGYRIFILSDDGKIMTSYMHLNELPKFRVGEVITEGQQIGTLGNSSSGTENASFGTHLHYELFVPDGNGGLEKVDPFMDGYYDPIDPQLLINSREDFNSDNYKQVYLGLDFPRASVDLPEVVIYGNRPPHYTPPPATPEDNVPMY